MKRGMKRSVVRLACATLALFCLTGAWAADAVIGVSQRAMSPNMTSQSYGARLAETALGDYMADSMRLGSGAELAIECGGHLVKSLPGGPLTEEDARGVFSVDRDVILVELTPEMLFDVLEYAVGAAQIDEAERLDRGSGTDRFPQISGFSLEFDVSQLPGRRVRRIVLSDGTELSRGDERRLTAALPADMLDGTLGFSMLEGLSGQRVGTGSALLIRHIAEQGQVAVPETGRMVMVGYEGDTLYESLHIGYFLPYVILLILLVRLVWRRKKAK